MDRHVQARLKREQVAWLVTTGKDLKPQAVLVWFHWDGKSFLIYAVDGAKVRHVRENANVELHLNSDGAGDDVIRASGQAAVAKRAKPNAAFVRKYRGAIKNLGMTVDGFFESYHNPIVIRRLKFR